VSFNYRDPSYYYGNDIGPDPIRVVLKSFCGGKAPPKFVKGYRCGNLPDKEHMQLVEWLLANAKVYWTIGIALVEAADKLVEEAVDNANIPPPEYWNEETLDELQRYRASLRKAKQRRKKQQAAKLSARLDKLQEIGSNAKRKPKTRR
jgi:hypothetical protein